MNFKVFFGLIIWALSMLSQAGWVTKCSNISRLQIWASGSDRYGVKLSLESNPESCAGFWVEHEAGNKELVYSLLLASLVSKNQVCIQYDVEQEKQDGACRLNFVYVDSK